MADITIQDTQDLFTRIIKILDPTNDNKQQHFIALLDSGCSAGDMITAEVVSSLGYASKIRSCDEVIGVCLNGHEIRSTGVVKIQWHVSNTYHVVDSWFHVIAGDSLPWQIVLGAHTCLNYHLIMPRAFAGRQVHRKKSKRDKEEDAKRKAKHDQEVAENTERVKADKAARDAAAVYDGTQEYGNNSSRSNSNTQ